MASLSAAFEPTATDASGQFTAAGGALVAVWVPDMTGAGGESATGSASPSSASAVASSTSGSSNITSTLTSGSNGAPTNAGGSPSTSRGSGAESSASQVRPYRRRLLASVSIWVALFVYIF